MNMPIIPPKGNGLIEIIEKFDAHERGAQGSLQAGARLIPGAAVAA